MANEKKEYQEWLELRKHIARQTVPISFESEAERKRRIQKLLNSFEDFCAFYFPHYIKAPFGWFHKQAAKKIIADPTILAILEWPREHAKSVFADVLIPMFLKAKGELTGMMIASDNGYKAAGLLGDIQAELMDNKRFEADFGSQYSFGNWEDGHFITADSCGFWSFGRGQSPRGTRSAEKRPNYGVIDDIDDAVIVKNDQRVGEAVDWVLGDFYGAMSIKGGRLVIAGNRIHKKSILAHLVGDVEPEDPKRENITHIKVFAIEGKGHREAAIGNPDARPAWKENYTLAELGDKMTKMGYRNAMREFFHRHMEKGHIFKPEHIIWTKPLPLKQYDALVTYNDPSFKDTKKNDYKAIVLVGKKGVYYDILGCWIRQATTTAMVSAHYDLHELVAKETGKICRHYMEANFIQDLLLDEYDVEGERRDYAMGIRPDKRKKPDKYGRIENLSPLFEGKKIRFSELLRKDVDAQTLKDQLLGFPFGHDDGPDALEGGIFLLNKKHKHGNFKPRMGKYNSARTRGNSRSNKGRR